MNSVHVKASLMLADGNVEIRRFTANEDITRSFTLFQHKLQFIFPQLNGIQFAVVWKDEENDDVTIGSDGELSIALSSLSGDLKKFQIYPKQHSVKMPLNESESDRNLFKNIQVICDECDSHVVGFRYKCLQCRNYDLCESCEAKHLHSNHIMLRLPETVSHGVCMDLFKKMHPSAIHLASAMESGCHKPERSCDVIFDRARLHHHKKCKNKHRGSFTCHEFGDMDEHCWEVKEKRKKVPLRKCAGTMYDFSEIYNTLVNPFAYRNENESANKTEEFHTSSAASAVGHSLGNILKPFVEAVHQGLMPKARSEHEKGPSSSSQGDKEENEKFHELVQKLGKKNVTHEASETMTEASAPPMEQSAPTNTQPEPENKTNVSPSPNDPKIENALQVMLSMGFTNEEDCLRNILEEMDGDIGKVLECIDNALKL